MATEAQKDMLSAPLNRSHVKQRTQAGRQLDYIEGWHAIAEANRIFGFDGWTRETVEMREVRSPQEVNGNWRVGYMAKVRVTALGVVREGTGYGSGIAKDMGDAIESAVKESETDAMKRALMTFGNPFGLALYDKTQANVEEAPAALTKAQARPVFERLSKANRDCPTEADFNKLWSHDATAKALASLPDDWRQTILAEKADKAAELAERAALASDPTEQFNQMEAAE